MTVAAWNDSEYVDATITAGTFQIEGSTTSPTTGYADHPLANAPTTLTFSAPVTAITPGTTVYSSFYVRTKATSVAGTITMQTPTFAAGSTGLQSSLTYGVRLLTSAQTCNAAAFTPTPLGTTIVAQATALSATITAPAPVITAAGGAVHQYCFALTLPGTADNTAQGLAAVPNWQFLATAT